MIEIFDNILDQRIVSLNNEIKKINKDSKPHNSHQPECGEKYFSLSGTITWLNISGKQFSKYIMNL